jgi:hypothetical protein
LIVGTDEVPGWFWVKGKKRRRSRRKKNCREKGIL